MIKAMQMLLTSLLMWAVLAWSISDLSWKVSAQPTGSNTNTGAMQRLGSIQFLAGGPSAGPITIPPYKLLVIEFVITGYSGADIGAFQFNGDATAANYGSWYAAMSNAATPLNSQTAVNAGTIAMIPVSGTPITLGRRGRLTISNIINRNKVVDITVANESATSTGPSIERGWGEWLNTTAQITQIQMVLVGANNLGAGTFATIYGDNP